MGTVTHPKPHLAIGDWRLAIGDGHLLHTPAS